MTRRSPAVPRAASRGPGTRGAPRGSGPEPRDARGPLLAAAGGWGAVRMRRAARNEGRRAAGRCRWRLGRAHSELPGVRSAREVFVRMRYRYCSPRAP